MSTVYWLGTADAVSQVSTGSIDSVDATPSNNTFAVTIGGVSISQVGDTNVATTAAALVASLNASTHPYFAAITWANPSAGNITGTADTAGVPFVAALTETGAGTGAVTDFSATTASSGPNDWSTAANWSGGAVPVNSDDVILADSSVSVLWGLDQSSVALGSLTIRQSYTGRVGLPRSSFATSALNTDSSKTEYRGTYLQIGTTALAVGQHFGPGSATGSGRIKLDLGATACTATIFDTASNSTDAPLPAVRLKANSASTDIYVRAAPGGVGVAADVPDETSTIRKMSVVGTPSSIRVQVGAGTTITTYEQQGGNNVLQSAGAVATVSASGGTLATEGAFAVTTLNARGGTVYPNSTGTVTTMNVDGGTVDLTASNVARTVTTLNRNSSGVVVYDPDVVTVGTLASNAAIKLASTG